MNFLISFLYEIFQRCPRMWRMNFFESIITKNRQKVVKKNLHYVGESIFGPIYCKPTLDQNWTNYFYMVIVDVINQSSKFKIKRYKNKNCTINTFFVVYFSEIFIHWFIRNFIFFRVIHLLDFLQQKIIHSSNRTVIHFDKWKNSIKKLF